MTPLETREAAFKANKNIWETKLGLGEVDFYKPREWKLASWISEVERQMGKLRFRPHWGSACSPYAFGGGTDWNTKTEPRKAA